MNMAYRTTAAGIANALLGRKPAPKARQRVSVGTTVFNGCVLGPKYLVYVTPEGGETECYEVYGRGLDALRSGMTPQEMDLEPYVEEDEDAPFDDDYQAELAWELKREAV